MPEIFLTPLQRFLAGASLALLLIGALLGYQYWQTLTQRNNLNAQLTGLEATVNKINAEGGVVNGPSAFPANAPNLELASLVLDSAAASGVTLSPIQAAAQGVDKVGSNDYRTVTVEVTVNGTLPQILDFFDRVERGNIKTVAFDNLQGTAADGKWSVRVQVIGYAQSS